MLLALLAPQFSCPKRRCWRGSERRLLPGPGCLQAQAGRCQCVLPSNREFCLHGQK